MHQTKIWGSSAQSLEQKPQQRTTWGWSGADKLDMSVLAFLVKSFHWGWLIVLECTELDKLWMQMKTRQWWKPACLGCGESARDVQAAGLLKQKNKKQTKQNKKSMEELVIGSNHFVVVDFLLMKKMKDCWWEQAAKNKENILAQRLVTNMKNNNKRKHVQTDVASSGKRYNTEER